MNLLTRDEMEVFLAYQLYELLAERELMMIEEVAEKCYCHCNALFMKS